MLSFGFVIGILSLTRTIVAVRPTSFEDEEVLNAEPSTESTYVQKDAADQMTGLRTHAFANATAPFSTLEEEERTNSLDTQGRSGWHVDESDAIEIQSILDLINTDPEDCVWTWRNRTDISSFSYDRILWASKIAGVALAKHLIFAHGFGAMYASRHARVDAFKAYADNNPKSELPRESTMMHTVRLISGFSQELKDRLVLLPLSALQHLHAFDHAWSLDQYGSEDRVFQAGTSKKAHDLLTKLGVKWDRVRQVQQEYRRFLMRMQSEERQELEPVVQNFGPGWWSDFQQVWMRGKSKVGNAAVEGLALTLQPGSSTQWVIQGKVSWESTGFVTRFVVPVTNDEAVEIYECGESEGTAAQEEMMRMKVQEWRERFFHSHFDFLKQNEITIWKEEVASFWPMFGTYEIQERIGNGGTGILAASGISSS
mmetsp:Transcript_768/g.1631  ORF Transcript_768/g.1631 Transcript_768/m.1631 type:complete len:427 (+) Transcript_768:121-1401(+)